MHCQRFYFLYAHIQNKRIHTNCFDFNLYKAKYSQMYSVTICTATKQIENTRTKQRT